MNKIKKLFTEKEIKQLNNIVKYRNILMWVSLIALLVPLFNCIYLLAQANNVGTLYGLNGLKGVFALYNEKIRVTTSYEPYEALIIGLVDKSIFHLILMVLFGIMFAAMLDLNKLLAKCWSALKPAVKKRVKG